MTPECFEWISRCRRDAFDAMARTRQTYETLQLEATKIISEWILESGGRNLEIDLNQTDMSRGVAMAKVTGFGQDVRVRLRVTSEGWKMAILLENPTDEIELDVDTNWDLFVCVRLSIAEQLRRLDPQMSFPF